MNSRSSEVIRSNLKNDMKSKWLGFSVFLLIYHLAFAFFTWNYSQQNMGDAYRYWHLTANWTAYFKVGTDVVRFINYPFSEILNLPFWIGFLLYNFIGYYAIYQLFNFAKDYINPTNKWGEYLLMFIFLFPNLHFWTSIIGKEPIIFLAITWIIINQVKIKYFSFQYVLGWILLILIRPHVAMFLLLAISFALIINDKGFSRQKILIVFSTLLLSLGLYLMTMQLLNRNPLDIAHILERNDASLIAFQRAESYVPMINYNVFERFFALNFRPLFVDSVSLYSFILSVENLFILILIFSSVLIYIYRFKEIRLDFFAKIALLFLIISSLFFIQRYSCLGIFVRTKVMYMPFVLIVAAKVIISSKSFNNSSRNK